jgi:hypothetical protein
MSLIEYHIYNSARKVIRLLVSILLRTGLFLNNTIPSEKCVHSSMKVEITFTIATFIILLIFNEVSNVRVKISGKTNSIGKTKSI